ncbi:hypothetical protein EV421DRAFT_1719022, partial [Armillaria borealis]
QRSQVEIAPNFAMTDYSSQGKMRPYNLIHLDYCQSHQACYTALLRMATAKGTILLQPLSPSKVQGGLNGALHQEFRELEMLDKITRLRYERCLPITIRGYRRYTLIDAYHKVKGIYYVPASVHPVITWSRALPFQPNFVEDIPWHIIEQPKKKAKQKGRHSDVFPPIPKTVQATKKGHIFSRSLIPAHDASANLYGTRWSNNSCTYDAFFAVVFNLWCSDIPLFSRIFHEINPAHLGFLSDSLTRHMAGDYTLIQV